MSQGERNKLAVIWSSGDPDVARSMVFMYTKNSRLKGWWETVRLVVWGASAKLLAQDQVIQAELNAVMEAGVEVYACRACCQMHQVCEDLEKMGVAVEYMGQPLTEMLKTDWTVLTF